MKDSKTIYSVIIGNGPNNRISFDLNEIQFQGLAISTFLDLGFVVTVSKNCENGKV